MVHTHTHTDVSSPEAQGAGKTFAQRWDGQERDSHKPSHAGTKHPPPTRSLQGWTMEEAEPEQDERERERKGVRCGRIAFPSRPSSHFGSQDEQDPRGAPLARPRRHTYLTWSSLDKTRHISPTRLDSVLNDVSRKPPSATDHSLHNGICTLRQQAATQVGVGYVLVPQHAVEARSMQPPEIDLRGGKPAVPIWAGKFEHQERPVAP